MVYLLRKNYTALFLDHEKMTRGKLAFKTQLTEWLNTESPVIIPISIQTAFHEGVAGQLKMEAFTSIIKENVKGIKTVLLTEKAHLNVYSLKCGGDKQKANVELLLKAQQLVERFATYFEGYKVVYWSEYINQDRYYEFFSKQVLHWYQTDQNFHSCVEEDAANTYTIERAQEYPDKNSFISYSIQDILEYCAYLLIIAHKGYRFQFYPGSNYKAAKYVIRNLLPVSLQLAHVDVFLSIEKKTEISLNKNTASLYIESC